MGLHDEAKLDAKFGAFAKQMNLYLNHFPKHEKYALAQEIRRKAYEVYGYIVEAQKRYHKKTTLTSLDIAHEQLRMLFRLAFGHARHTASWLPLITHLTEHHHALAARLPQAHHRPQHLGAAAA